MKQKRVFLMCGIPGSGKSTWVQTQLTHKNDISISRDQIRFSFLSDDDDYFKHEDVVFSCLVQLVQQYIDDTNFLNIYVDATHLTEKSRNKLLNQLFHLNTVDIIPVWFNVSVDVAIRRNAQRTGRAYVPPKVIHRMSMQQTAPTFSERHHYSEIWEVDENFNIKKMYR